MTSNIVYRLGTQKDFKPVLKFLRKHFYPYEVLRNSFKPRQQDEYDEQAIVSHIANEPATSHVSLCGAQIVGTFLATPKTPERANRWLEEASRIPGTKWATMLVFMARLERDASVFSKYKVNKAMHGHGLAVHDRFRTKRIGFKLGELSLKRAKELGYTLFTCDCMSSYSASICEHMGFDCVNEVPYADYRAPGSDKQIFFPPKDHPVVKTFAKRL